MGPHPFVHARKNHTKKAMNNKLWRFLHLHIQGNTHVLVFMP